jgi:hypothetical protein
VVGTVVAPSTGCSGGTVSGGTVSSGIVSGAIVVSGGNVVSTTGMVVVVTITQLRSG